MDFYGNSHWTDTRFWDEIAKIGWGLGKDRTFCKEVRITMMQQGREFCQGLYFKYDEMYHKLVMAMYHADSSLDHASLDTMAHIIGLGPEEFHRCLKDPTLIKARSREKNYQEGFSVCIPNSANFEALSAETLNRRREGLITRYQRGQDGPFQSEVTQIIRLLGDEDWLDNADALRQLSENVEQRAIPLFGTNPDSALTNKWWAWNLLKDATTAARIRSN